MIVTFSGFAGSGKSGIAKRLAETLESPYYDMGMLRRTAAEKRGMTLAEYNALGETDPTTDTDIDEYQTELGKTQDNFVIVGRTSWHFIPHSFKIFLTVRPDVGAERVLKSLHGRNEGEGLETVEAIIESNRLRIESDRLRYKKYFNIDAYDQSNYDWVLDTSDLTEEEVFATVLAEVKKRLPDA